MTTLPTVVGLSDFLPVIVLSMGLLAFMALVLIGMRAENRNAYFRRWIPAILITAGVTVAAGFWIQKLHSRSLRLKNQMDARQQMQALRLAAAEHMIEFGNWPAGDNRQVIEKLRTGSEKDREFLGRSNLKFAPDGSALDPWGRPYLIAVDPETGLAVQSCGPDGIKDTEDDLP
jgi:Type II secretion system (T2SS), protein G